MLLLSCLPFQYNFPSRQITMRSNLLLLQAILGGVTLAVDPLVKLNYTSYEGTALSNGVTQWLGLRYAAPPVGDLRFAAPRPPSANSTVQHATAHGPICLGTASGPPTNVSSEDCL